MVHRAAEAALPSKYGNFRAVAYENDLDDLCHVAIVKGEVSGKKDVLVRVHSECLTGDAFGSLRCDCGDQLATALRMIEKEGCGVVLYMRQEGRGIGLANKIRLMRCRIRVMIPLKPMLSWALLRICVIMVSELRSFPTWA